MPLHEPLLEVGTADVEPVSTTTTNNANLGIDLNSALEILSLRSSMLPQNQTIENENPNDFDMSILQQNLNGLSSKVGCGCCSHVHSLDESDCGIALSQQPLPSGQLLDMGTTTTGVDYEKSRHNNAGDGSLTVDINPTMLNEATASDILDKQEKQKMAQQQAVARQEQLSSTIHSMTTNDAISAIFHTQEERVKCYRFFDDGLEYVLDTGNVEHYPLVCADVTATFTVLSATINAIRSDLVLRTLQSAHEIVELINRLQRAEQTKLQLTAALHLEMMRRHAQHQQTSSISNGHMNNDQTGRANEVQPIDSNVQILNDQQDRIASLLKDSIHALRRKIALTIDEINDTLEELRYIDANNNE